jgi:putative PIN family toxin of toxin-antitoxin system
MSVLAVYDCTLFFMHAARPDRVRETFQLVQSNKVVYCLSTETLSEIQDVLTGPKHQRQFPRLSPESVAIYLQEIIRGARFVENVPLAYVLKCDPKDSKYINLALAANAPYLVTRDLDLLDLMNEVLPVGREFRRRFPHLRIVDPETFVAEVKASVS